MFVALVFVDASEQMPAIGSLCHGCSIGGNILCLQRSELGTQGSFQEEPDRLSRRSVIIHSVQRPASGLRASLVGRLLTLWNSGILASI